MINENHFLKNFHLLKRGEERKIFFWKFEFVSLNLRDSFDFPFGSDLKKHLLFPVQRYIPFCLSRRKANTRSNLKLFHIPDFT